MIEQNQKGREKNAAAPLGSRPGLISDKKTKEIGRQSTRKAGPDGPNARVAAEALKKG